MGRRVDVRRLRAGRWPGWMEVIVIEGQCGREKAVSEATDGVVLR